MRSLKKFNFSKVYDLQNSSRTSFYKKILFPKANSDIWCSSETTLPKDKVKEDFNKYPVSSNFFSKWFHTVGYSSVVYDIILLVVIYVIYIHLQEKTN